MRWVVLDVGTILVLLALRHVTACPYPQPLSFVEEILFWSGSPLENYILLSVGLNC